MQVLGERGEKPGFDLTQNNPDPGSGPTEALHPRANVPGT